MATKKKKAEETGVLPVNFFGDVVAAQAPAIISYEYKYGDNSVEVKCKPSLSYKEKAEFVKSLWSIYYSADVDGKYDYRPYLIELCIRYFTVRFYCVNVPLDDKTDISMYENFLTNTDFYDKLLQHINIADYKSLIGATQSYVDKMAELHMASVRSNADITIDSILADLFDVVNSIDKDRVKELLLANNLFSEGDNDTQRTTVDEEHTISG